MSAVDEYKMDMNKNNPIHFNELSAELKGSRFMISTPIDGSRHEIRYRKDCLESQALTNKYGTIFYENLAEAQEDLEVLNKWTSQFTYTDRISNGIVVTLCHNHVSVISKFSKAKIKWSLFQSYVDESLNESYSSIHSLCEGIIEAMISLRTTVDLAYSAFGGKQELKEKYKVTLVASAGMVTISAPDFIYGNVRAMNEDGDRCDLQAEAPLIKRKTEIIQLTNELSQYCYSLEDCIKSTLDLEQSFPFNIH